MVLVVFTIGCQDPPTASLEKARQALKQATKAGSRRYSEKTYQVAEKLMQTGWMEMARQNGRFAPMRDYKTADSIFRLAIVTANQASNDAEKYLFNLKFMAQTEQDDLRNELTDWQEALNGSLKKLKAEPLWNRARLALETSKKLMEIGEYEEARLKVVLGAELLRKMAEVMAEYDNDEAKKINIWRRWVQETVAESKNSGNYALVVDKSKHKLYLLQGGKVINTYTCELGYNSAHQKLFSGDGATPEGKYNISAVKANGNSKYYKALLLNYPNETDQERFHESKERGIISSRARIGGLIEIHGEGGKYRDWTEGCVALTNDDMNRLLRYVTVGTPVTIVRRSDRWP